MSRKPVIDPTCTWGIVENPFGDEPQAAGWAVWCYDPVTGQKTITSEILESKQAAEDELRRQIDY